MTLILFAWKNGQVRGIRLFSSHVRKAVSEWCRDDQE
jgi:hypothetical protein